MEVSNRVACAGVVIAALMLAGCGGGPASTSQGGSSPVSAPSSTPSATASSTTPAPTKTPTVQAVLTREQAGRRYLALIKVSNDELSDAKCMAAQGYYLDGGSWPPAGRPEYGQVAHKTMRDCFKTWMPSEAAVIRGLQTTRWPVDAREDVADLISYSQAVLHCYRQATRATTDQGMYEAFDCIPKDDGAADRVRARFGLPRRKT